MRWQRRFRRWHRKLASILMFQWCFWVVTALGMALVPRAWTRAYPPPSPSAFDAAAEWPVVDALPARVSNWHEQPTHIELYQPGVRPVLSVRHGENGERVWLTTDAAEELEPLGADALASSVATMTGENIAASDITLKTGFSPEYQKAPLPVVRVAAVRATLFFHPVTGAFLDQATTAKRFENWMKTVHTLDFSGNAEFRGNVLLALAGVSFFLTSMFGVLSFRKLVLFRRGADRAFRWHQALGLVLMVQVFFWTSTGMSVIWLLEHRQITGETHAHDRVEPIDFGRVSIHPTALVTDRSEPPTRVTLTMLLDRPVYRLTWPGRPIDQALFDAGTGEAITPGASIRDELAGRALANPDSIERWEEAAAPDYHFFAGPFPVWKAYYREPWPGVLAIDQTTGRVHTPARTDRGIAVELYYKLHVVNWAPGVIRYRLEPLLIFVILLMASMIGTGAWLVWGSRRHAR